MNIRAKKFEIIALKDKCREILEEMQLKGIAEIISLKEEGPADEDLDFDNEKNKTELRLAEMNFARTFLSNFVPKQGFITNLLNSISAEKKKYSLAEMRNLADSRTMQQVVSRCVELEKEINCLDSEKESLNREIEELRKFSGISFISCQTFKNFDIFVGSIDKKRKQELLAALRQKSIFFHIKWAGEEDCRQSGFYMVFPKNETGLIEIIKSKGAKEENVFWQQLPRDLLREKRNKLIELEKRKSNLIKDTQKLSRNINKLEALADWYAWELEKLEAIGKGKKTKKYFYLQAWVLENRIADLEKIISNITPYFLIKQLKLGKNESPPVEMSNKSIMKSFEIITGVYGLPKPDEPDPTPYLAPFFAVAFGLALSDAGYGILLMVVSYLMGKKIKKARAFFYLFAIAGYFTIIAGILTGTFFGTDALAQYRLIDAVSSPITILFLVSILGLIQIFAGILVGLFWNLKQGRLDIALGAKGGAVAFFLGLGAFAFTFNIIFLWAGMATMMLMNIIFSKEKNIFKRFFFGFGSLYGIIGYFSDVLSYSRLLALGLATGIIAMTINMIASIFMEMIPVPGLNLVIAAIVLSVGHLANLLINALSSFIHSARLQFVEFFSKFMEGGGRQFKPFSKQGRFVEIIN